MHPFLDAIYKGDVLYTDVVCNLKRAIFVDCTGMQLFIVNIHVGNGRYKLLVNGRNLMLQLRRLGVNFEEGWNVYNVRNHVV